MLYKPKFCSNCAEKIERVDWNLLTSRRFCDVCAVENKRYDLIPRVTVAVGMLSLMFGFGTLFGGSSASNAPVQVISPVKPRAEKLSEPVSGPSAETTSVPPFASPNISLDSSPETARTKNGNNQAPERVYYCGALTKKGTPCSRKVKAAGLRCYQHEGKPVAAGE